MNNSFREINNIQITPTNIKIFNNNFKWLKMIEALIRG